MNNQDCYKTVETPFLGRYSEAKVAIKEAQGPDYESSFSFRELIDSIKGDGSGSESSSSSKSSGGSGESGGVLGTVGSVFSGLLGGVGAALPGLVSVLPAIGIGSKSRIRETEAQANAQIDIINAQSGLLMNQLSLENKKSRDQKQLLLIGGVLLLVIVVLIYATK